MRTVNQIREAIAAKLADVEAIQAVATAENRELAADESARIDAILGAGDVKGELDALRQEESRALKIEAAKAEIVARTAPQTPAPRDLDDAPSARIVIPARAQMQPSHIRGERAAERAYSFGQWLFGMLGNAKSREWSEQHGFGYRNAMTEGVDSKGGFLVPEQFDSTIIDLRNSYGVARRESRRAVMSSDTLTMPRRTGGLTAYFVAEAGTITASDKTLDQVRLTAKKLGAIARMSSELSEDAVISIADDVASEIAYAFAEKEDGCFFNGDGTSTYGGMVGIKNALAAGSKYTAATGHTAFATLTLDDFHGMKGLLADYAYSSGGPKWYISRAGYSASMESLMHVAGGNVAANIAAGGPMMFLGYPVEFVNVMNNTLGAQTSTSGLVYFGNLRLATMFGDRRGIALATSSDVYFTTDEIAIRGTERFDVNIHDVGTASVAGGLVQLATPGS